MPITLCGSSLGRQELLDLLRLLCIHAIDPVDLLAVLVHENRRRLGDLQILLSTGVFRDVDLVGVGRSSEGFGIPSWKKHVSDGIVEN